MTVTTDTMNRPGFRPHLSEMGEAMRAPAKAPACITETMFAERLALASLSVPKPKSLDSVSKCKERARRWIYYSLKGVRVITPPMMPMSMPKSIPPKHACRFVRFVISSVEYFRIRTHGTSNEEDPPAVDLWRVHPHGLIFDDSL